MNAPAAAHEQIKIRLTQIADFSFNIHFDDTDAPDLITDEPAPLGKGEGPNPSRVLLAAVANCLSASLLFALRKFKNQPTRIDAEVRGTLGRNEEGRLRVQHVEVDLNLGDDAGAYEHLDRILQQFERFCVVTESVRDGIDVAVAVRDASGTVVHRSGGVA